MYSITKFPCHTNHATFNKLIFGVHSFAHKQKHSSRMHAMPFYSSLVSHIMVHSAKKDIRNNGPSLLSRSNHSINSCCCCTTCSTPPTVILTQKTEEGIPLSDNERLLFVCGSITLYYLLLYNSHLGHAHSHTKTHHYYIVN